MYQRFIIDEGYSFIPHDTVRFRGLSELPDEPLVSIIMPAYNQERYIADSVESVLTQDYERIDLLVVDAASSDRTLEVLNKFSSDKRLRWISEPDRCVNDGILKGLKLASGPIFGVQCSSDIYMPGVISKAVGEYRQDPGLFSVSGLCQDVKADGTVTVWDDIGKHGREYLSCDQIIAFLIPPIQSSFFRREILGALGGFDERFRTCHTVYYLHFFLEGFRMGCRALVVPEVWGVFTRHPQSVTSTILSHTMDVYKERVLASNQALEVFSSILGGQQQAYLRERRYLPDEIRIQLEAFAR